MSIRTIAAPLALAVVLLGASCSSDSKAAPAANGEKANTEQFCRQLIELATKAGVMKGKTYDMNALSRPDAAEKYYRALLQHKDQTSLAPSSIRPKLVAQMDYLEKSLGNNQVVNLQVPYVSEVLAFQKEACGITL